MNLIVSPTIFASRRSIFDVSICDLGWQDALVLIDDLACKPDGQVMVAFANAHNILLSLKDAEYREVLASNIVLPDGVGLDIASGVEHGSAFPANLNGTDFVPALLTFMHRPRKIGLIGGQRSVVDKAAAQFAHHAPWHEFLVISDGFFDKNEPSDVIAEVERQKLDILLIGMGTPLQEKWAARYIKPEHARLVITVGALFDFVSGNVPRAPESIRWMRMEWAFRLLQEPTRLWRRYILGIPAFFYHIGRFRYLRRHGHAHASMGGADISTRDRKLH